MNGHSKKSSSPQPLSVKVSKSELKAGKLSWRNLEIATRALHRDGLVVLEDVIEHQKLDKLNDKMVEDAWKLRERKDSPYNYHRGNVQQDPPLTKEWFEESIFINPIVTQITSTTLGPLPRLSFISGNTALPLTSSSPDSERQPTHTDADFDHPHSPFALVVNVPLVEMTPHNGSTEVLLGTHSITTIDSQEGVHGDRASGRIRQNVLEERIKERAPCQPVVPKGAVIVRDLRLWHGGMPNLSKEPRVMLAFIHFAPWYRNPMHVEFASDLAPLLTPAKTGLQVQADFMPAAEIEKRYLNRSFGNDYDFDQQDRLDDLF